MVYQTWLRNQACKTGTINGKGAAMSEVGGDVIECIFKDTPTYSRVTGNTKDETPVCNMTDKGEEGNRCYCSAYTGCNRRNVRDFGRVFLMLNYTDITQNPYIQSWTVTEIMSIEMCGLLGCRHTVRRPWHHTCPTRMPARDMVMQSAYGALTSQDNRSAAACVKYLEV